VGTSLRFLSTYTFPTGYSIVLTTRVAEPEPQGVGGFGWSRSQIPKDH